MRFEGGKGDASFHTCITFGDACPGSAGYTVYLSRCCKEKPERSLSSKRLPSVIFCKAVIFPIFSTATSSRKGNLLIMKRRVSGEFYTKQEI